MGNSESAAIQTLATLAAGAPTRSPNVRTLAAFAANSGCKLATVGFAARVDFDQLLEGTQYAVPFGQSSFAFGRGNTFENKLRANGHAPVFELFRDHLHYDISQAVPRNLRPKGPPIKDGMRLRAEATEAVLAQILGREKGAPNLLDGAVLRRDVGGIPAYFEADAVAAHFSKPIHAGEVKSFPTVDGQADPDKVGAAMEQVSIYILLLRDLVTKLGGDPSLVSSEALLITPKNTGLQPTMTVKDVSRNIDRARRILEHAPNAIQIASSLPAGAPTFGQIAVQTSAEPDRVRAANELADRVGTTYGPSCLSSCGMSRLCRDRSCGTTRRVGGNLLRILPNIESLDRVKALAEGGKPTNDEQSIAEQLVRAERLLQKARGAATSPVKMKKVGT